MTKKIKTALKQIRRTPYQGLAAVLILSLTFFFVSGFILISAGFYLIFQYFEASPQIIAYFERGHDLEEEEIAKIQAKLEKNGKLASFEYVSTSDAEKIYKEDNKDDPLLNELVDHNILPPSIEISADNIESLRELNEIMVAEPLVEDIDFHEDVVNKLSSWLANIRLLGVGMIGFLLLLSVLILVIIIGLKIKNKRVEIEILRLLGASNWYIYGPYLIEGIIYGFLGAFFGWLGGFTLLQYSTPFLIDFLDDIIVLPVDFAVLLILLGVLVLGGMIVGALSSILAVRRFVKI